ncbi:UPF0481 protein At3g47200-like [Elaeis guineensis]|uniref:UPF0481 protein At3g02645 n=1 Tax=Elaeis guineensis var. tenera TaxID=51953 RepID=A0A8N4IEJ0_ELAGV|nr:putative UPF0481 protein At3g02645 [Elaeis guineensis]
MEEKSPDDILHSLSIEGGEECSSASRGMPSSATSMTNSKTNLEEISWMNKVRKNINLARHVDHPNSRRTIFKVPEHIRQLDPKAYTPVVAPFGPFHHTDPYSTSAIQAHKWRCVRHLLSRHQSQKTASQLLDECLLDLKKQDDKVRSYYSEEISALNAEDMALIMLLDGCFIVYLMLRREKLLKKMKKKGMEEKMEEVDKDVVRILEYETIEVDESKKRRECMIHIGEGEVVLNIEEKDEQLEGPTAAGLFTLDLVVYDLLKLENQIPFFIIRFLFDQLKPCGDEEIDLVKLALQLFEGIRPEESKTSKKKKKKLPSKYHHLLHLFYSSRIPSGEIAGSTSKLGCIPSAIECIKSKWKKVEADPSQGSTQGPHPSQIKYGMSMSMMKAPAPFQGSAQGSHPHLHSVGMSMSAMGVDASLPGLTQGSPPMSMKMMAAAAPLQRLTQGTSMSPVKWIPSAIELDRAGVKFKRKEQADNFLNITFEQRKMKNTPLLCLLKLCLMFRSGQMEIPPLQIYDYTGPLFKNLIAFEQCYVDTKMYITIYALFMDCIIDQAKDVRLLLLKDILEHRLGNDQEVAGLFNQLGNQIHFDMKKNYLANQIEEVKSFYDSKWHQCIATLWRDYFGNPWATISVLAAIVLLLLTVGQAIFSALSYFHPS